MANDKLPKVFKKIIEYIFEALFFTLALFFTAEVLKKGIVTNYISFNALLTLTLFFGIIVVVFSDRSHSPLNLKGHIFRALRLIIAVTAGVFVGALAFLLVPTNFTVYLALPWIIGIGVCASILAFSSPRE